MQQNVFMALKKLALSTASFRAQLLLESENITLNFGICNFHDWITRQFDQYESVLRCRDFRFDDVFVSLKKFFR